MVAEDVQHPAELVEEVFEMLLAQPVGGAPLYEPFARYWRIVSRNRYRR